MPVHRLTLRLVTEAGVDLIPLTVTLTMIGKFAMTAAFGTVVLYAQEIYPTNVRCVDAGFSFPFSLICTPAVRDWQVTMFVNFIYVFLFYSFYSSYSIFYFL